MTDLHSEIAELEKELFEKQKALHEMRRQLPRVPVENYEFLGPGGQKVTLKQLFGAHDDLIIVHNMGSECRYCTLWADGFNGLLPHLESRAAFVIISPDLPAAQKEFADSRGWRFAMVSERNSTFTFDMGMAEEREGQIVRTPGYSTFKREPEGGLFRISQGEFYPGDVYSGIWHMFANLADGAAGWHPRLTYRSDEE